MHRAFLVALLVIPVAAADRVLTFEYVGGASMDNPLFYVAGVCDEYRPFSPLQPPFYTGGVCGVPINGHVRIDTYEDGVLITGFRYYLYDATGAECYHAWALWNASFEAPVGCGTLDVLMGAGSVHGFIVVATG